MIALRVFWLGVRDGWATRGRGFDFGMTYPSDRLNNLYDRGVNLGRGHWRET